MYFSLKNRMSNFDMILVIELRHGILAIWHIELRHDVLAIELRYGILEISHVELRHVLII